MMRRSVVCQFDAHTEQPEARNWAGYNIEVETLKERPRLLSAALRHDPEMVAAELRQDNPGRPKDAKAVAGDDDWATFVRDPLMTSARPTPR